MTSPTSADGPPTRALRAPALHDASSGPGLERHGHGIAQAIRTQSDDLLRVETGSLYPALHRLEKRGWLDAEWGVSEANQKAKYYRLTPAGKAQLTREQDRWSQLVSAIGRVMEQAPAADE